MPNTVYGPYTKTTWTNGTTPLNSTNLSNLETQASDALHGFNPDLIAAGFIDYGIICYKDSSVANQLDITNGVAYVILSDGTVGRITVVTTTQTTSALNSTYNLYLQPDGTWYWSTSNSPATNSLYIATVTTDGSGNILVVTDKRTLVANAFPNLVGTLELPAPLGIQQTQNPTLAGQVNGGVTFGVAGALLGDYNQAATLNGSTGYVSLPTTSLPTGNGAWTLESWFKTSTTAATQYIVSLGGSSSKTAALLYVNSTNMLVADLFGSNIHSTGTVTNGAYHHGVATWDGTNLTLYLDGSVAAGPTSGLGPDNIAYGSALIGASNFGGIGSFFNGTLDEVAIYGAALSSARVTAHFNAATSTTTGAYAAAVLADSPLRYYRLGDAVGVGTAADTISATLQQILGPDGALTVPGTNMNFYAGQCGLRYNPFNTEIELQTPLSGAANGYTFIGWNGASATFPFSIGAPGVGGQTVINNSGTVTAVAGQGTAGSFGVPIVKAVAKDVSVTTTSIITIASFTAPNDGVNHIIRAFLQGWVGSGNTNNGVISMAVSVTDPVAGATSMSFYDTNRVASVTGEAVTKGQGIIPIPIMYEVSPNTTVSVTYRNTAAGTISDKASGILELLA